MSNNKYAPLNSRGEWEELYSTRGTSRGNRKEPYIRICRMNLVGKKYNEAFSILDLGCGSGYGIKVLREFFPYSHIHGYDFSSNAINHCRKHLPGCSFKNFDIYSNEFPQQYDVIFFIQTLEHLNNPYTIVKKVLNTAKNRLIVSVPYRDRMPDPHHINIFNEDSFDHIEPAPKVLIDGQRVYYIFIKNTGVTLQKKHISTVSEGSSCPSLSGDINKTPLVSVIIPNYNYCKYIRDTLECLWGQTLKDWEAIIIDDCSTDNSVEIIKEYCRKDRRYKLLSTGTNQGSPNARNIGIKAARGKYLAMLDSDYVLLPESLARRIQVLESGFDFVYSDYIYMHNRQRINGRPFDAKLLYEMNYIPCLTVMFRRDIIQRVGYFDVSFKSADDYEMWLRIASHGYRFRYIPEIIAFYRVHSSNKSSRAMKVGKMDEYRKRLKDKYRELIVTNDIKKKHEFDYWKGKKT